MRTYLISVLLPALLLLSSTIGHAADTCPDKPTAKKAQRALAGEWFAKGQELGKKRKGRAALDSFLCSMVMVEHPATYDNIKRSVKMMDDKEDAIAKLDNYLKGAPKGELTTKIVAIRDDLEAKLPKSEPKPEPVAVVATASTSPAPTGFSWKYPAWASFGASGSALITGIIFQALAISAYNEKNSAPSLSEEGEAERARHIHQGAAIAAFSISAVTAGAGILMLLWDKKATAANEAPTNQTSRLRLSPTPGGLLLSGTF